MNFSFVEFLVLFLLTQVLRFFFFKVFISFFYFFLNKYTKNEFTNVTNIKIQQNVYKIRK